MPFRSERQRKWMHANRPDMAKRWEGETPPGRLPEHAPPKDTPKRKAPKPPKRRRK
jgi:hypothetical protein